MVVAAEIGLSADRRRELPATARALLSAGKRLLRDEGFDALRFERIEAESGENKALIRYYFGSKAGFVAALVDDLVRDAAAETLSEEADAPQDRDRFSGHLAMVADMIHRPGFTAFLDILPYALRDPELRVPLAKWYVGLREVNAEKLAVGHDAVDPAEIEAMAGLVVAVFDGLAIQAALDPEWDAGPSVRALERMVDLAFGGETPPRSS